MHAFFKKYDPYNIERAEMKHNLTIVGNNVNDLISILLVKLI
jgi:hypothetical protein